MNDVDVISSENVDSNLDEALVATKSLIKRKVYKNLILIGVVWLLMFSAFNGLSFLQSSVNSEAGLGVIGLSVIYATLCLSALFVSSPVISRFGTKWTMSFSLLGYTIYVAINFYPTFYTIIPASILLGMCGAPVWAAMSVHLSELAKNYHKLNLQPRKTLADINGLFFGIFSMFFSLSALLGNLISSLALRQPSLDPSKSNVSLLNTCGVKFCPLSPNSTGNINRPSDVQFYIMMAIFLSLAVLSYLLLTLAVDALPMTNTKINSSVTSYLLTVIRNTGKQLINGKQLALTLLTIYVGLTQSFSQGEFTKAFVACTTGVGMVGFTMMAYGASSMVFSFVAGKMVAVIGRISILYIAIANHLWIQIYFHFWQPDPNQIYLFFIFAALLGLSDAIWNSQLNALYASTFGSSETAFSSYRLWEAVGYIIGFATGTTLCTQSILLLLTTFLVAGTICLTVFALWLRISLRNGSLVHPNS